MQLAKAFAMDIKLSPKQERALKVIGDTWGTCYGHDGTINALGRKGLIEVEYRRGARPKARLTELGRAHVTPPAQPLTDAEAQATPELVVGTITHEDGGEIVKCESCGEVFDNYENGFFFPTGDCATMPAYHEDKHYCDACGSVIADKYDWWGDIRSKLLTPAADIEVNATSEPAFKVGDRVYHIYIGWGTVSAVNQQGDVYMKPDYPDPEANRPFRVYANGVGERLLSEADALDADEITIPVTALDALVSERDEALKMIAPLTDISAMLAREVTRLKAQLEAVREAWGDAQQSLPIHADAQYDPRIWEAVGIMDAAFEEPTPIGVTIDGGADAEVDEPDIIVYDDPRSRPDFYDMMRGSGFSVTDAIHDAEDVDSLRGA